jgi:hypothetical protein
MTGLFTTVVSMNVLAYIFSDASLNNIKRTYFLVTFNNSEKSCLKVPNCGGPAASLQYTVSLVHWVNCLLPAYGGQQFMS